MEKNELDVMIVGVRDGFLDATSPELRKRTMDMFGKQLIKIKHAGEEKGEDGKPKEEEKDVSVTYWFEKPAPAMLGGQIPASQAC